MPAARAARSEAIKELGCPAEMWRPAWTPPSVVHLLTDASGDTVADGASGNGR